MNSSCFLLKSVQSHTSRDMSLHVQESTYPICTCTSFEKLVFCISLLTSSLVGGPVCIKHLHRATQIDASIARVADHASSNPAVAEHVVLPILQLLLEAVRPEPARPSGKRPPKSAPPASSATAADAAVAAVDRAQPTAAAAGDTAVGVSGIIPASGASRRGAEVGAEGGAAPHNSGGVRGDAGAPSKGEKGGAKADAAAAPSAASTGAPVSFSDFMSGRWPRRVPRPPGCR